MLPPFGVGLLLEGGGYTLLYPYGSYPYAQITVPHMEFKVHFKFLYVVLVIGAIRNI
jgi:hypothetical protein